MFYFGHVGIGRKIVSPFARGLPAKAILIGTILPDLIDKPLFYGWAAWHGRPGSDLGLMSGTRTFAHTALFLVLLTLIATLKRSRTFAALSLGVASHLLLDTGSSALISEELARASQISLLWPLRGMKFPNFPHASFWEHLLTLQEPILLGGEIVGILLIFWDYRKRQRNRRGSLG
jgi:hypothetical protein